MRVRLLFSILISASGTASCTLLLVVLSPAASWALASNNVPLDSPMYLYLEKLAGFGLIDTDINGLKPFSKAEAARLVMEAERNLEKTPDAPELAREMIASIRELLPREVDLYGREDKAPTFDLSPLTSCRFRYVYLDGEPRDFDRLEFDPGADGFLGIGHLIARHPPGTGSVVPASGRESTPLMENNDGIVYQNHNNFETRLDTEGFAGSYASALLEPMVISRPGERRNGSCARLFLNKAYVKLGGHGLELEVGRDENWFGQGFRGTTILTDNSRNMDEIKLSSPEPVDWPWFKRHIGLLKYALVFSRLDESGSGASLRRPWFVAVKLSIKPTANFEGGVNFSRQEGGPNVIMPGLIKEIFTVGTSNNGSNTLAGFEMRWRFPWLRGTTVYWEYYGEDSVVVLPVIGSHIAGVYVPRLTSDGRNDFRFEFFMSHPIAYTDGKYPEGYTSDGLIIGHPMGRDVKEYFARFTHYFSARNSVALEYFHTQRGRLGRTGDEAVEDADAGRIFWRAPVTKDWDLLLNYGYQDIRNFNLVRGERRENQIFRMDIAYRY